jgi:hypothetical protein
MNRLPSQITATLAMLMTTAAVVTAQESIHYDLSTAVRKGEIVSGPRTIIADGLNPLRYDYKWNVEVKFDAAPDLWSKLLDIASPGAMPAAGTPTKGAGFGTSKKPADNPSLEALVSECKTSAKAEYAPLDGQLADTYCRAAARKEMARLKAQAAVELYQSVFTHRTQVVLQINCANQASAAVGQAGRVLTGFVGENGHGANATIKGIDALLDPSSTPNPTCPGVANYTSDFMRGLKTTWPDLTGLRSQGENLKAKLDSERAAFDAFNAESSASLATLSGEIKVAVADLTAKLANAEKAINAKPSDKDKAAAVENLKTAVSKLQISGGFLEETKGYLALIPQTLDAASKEQDRTIKAIADADESGSKYGAFKDAQAVLVQWQSRMSDIRNARDHVFSSAQEATCDFAFAQTKKNVFTLSRVDRLPGSKSSSSEDILGITVECTSPFVVSAGVAFSSLREREFAIVQSSDGKGGTLAEFEAVVKSGFHPLPLGMITVRWCEYGRTVSLNSGFGLAGNFRSQSSGGSNAEFLFSPVSLGLFRTMFLSPGLHIGREVKLGGGFKEGDVAPSNLSQAPLDKSYRVGFGFSITFTKP